MRESEGQQSPSPDVANSRSGRVRAHDNLFTHSSCYDLAMASMSRVGSVSFRRSHARSAPNPAAVTPPPPVIGAVFLVGSRRARSPKPARQGAQVAATRSRRLRGLVMTRSSADDRAARLDLEPVDLDSEGTARATPTSFGATCTCARCGSPTPRPTGRVARSSTSAATNDKLYYRGVTYATLSAHHALDNTDSHA